MPTSTETEITPLDEPAITFDLRAARAIVRRRRRAWLAGGAVLFLLFALIGLLLQPQSFLSTVSLSVQQNNGGLPLLSGLPMLGGGAAKKYVGVIKSRRLAEQVSREIGLRNLYDLPTEDDAVELMTRSVVADDNPADGLLYLNVTLSGPPALRPRGNFRQRVKRAAADAANRYAALLREYVVYSDNDRELVLLRAAKQQLAKARTDYARAVSRLGDFVKETRMAGENVPIPITASAARAGSATSTDTTSATAATMLQQLYLERGRIEADLRSTERAQATRKELMARQLSDPSRLPNEDSLLGQARRNVIVARTELRNLLVQYGDDAPPVRIARARLKNYDDRLRLESATVRKGLTTDFVTAETQRRSLQSKLNAVVAQISKAERDLQLNREMTTDFESLRNEVTLRLEVLKTTASQGAVLGIQTVSAQNRITVVDDAKPARRGRPGIAVILAACLFLTALVIGAWFAWDYANRPRMVGRLDQ